MAIIKSESDYGSTSVNTIQAAAGAGQRDPSYKVYGKRWAMLLLFSSYSASNAFQWNEYVIIDDIIKDHYHVSTLTIEWTTMCYMAVYIPLIFPVTYLIEHRGLRAVALTGAALNMLGAWVKVGSAEGEGRFWLSMSGQVVCGVAQVFILGLPARLAAVWFGADQVSTATAIGVFGNQVGIALGFLVPPLVTNACAPDVTKALNILFYSLATLATVQLILVWFVFEDRPPLPPSASQAALLDTRWQCGEWGERCGESGEQCGEQGEWCGESGEQCGERGEQCGESGEQHGERSGVITAYIHSIGSLITQRSYMLLLVAYGLNVGVFYCISTLLNRIIIHYFDSAEHISGVTGLILVISGLFGSLLAGLILDRTKAYKDVTMFVYSMSVTGMLLFTFLLPYRSTLLIYIIAALLGFFMTGYLPIGFEYAVELTFPLPEGTSSGLINMSAQVCGIFMILVGGSLTELSGSGPQYTGLFMATCLTGGLYLTYMIKSDLKRQAATVERERQEEKEGEHRGLLEDTEVNVT